MAAVLVAVVFATVLGACTRRSPRPESPIASEPGTGRATDARDETEHDGRALLLRGGRVMTATGVIYDPGDVLVVGRRIAAVGPELEAPAKAEIVDVRGKTITPGLIDTHSHIGVYPSPHLRAHEDGNEIVAPTTAGVRALDGYWPQDPQIDRARAGGVTTMQILPGSANLIGGGSFTVKLYPGVRSAADARFVGAPEGLKMACGENPKRVYRDKGGPYTRMGNIAGFRAAFEQAVAYRRKWKRHREELMRWKAEHQDDAGTCGAKKKTEGNDDDGKNALPPEPPDRDLALETLVEVLEGRRLVHNHCYRADEMSIMMDLAEEYGFSIRSFHHAVEAYKIADRLAERGVAASVWADWWGFKIEAFDGIRENAALVSHAGARAVIHSDSAVGIQRLNQEAAKAMWAGRRAGIEISDDEALRWITLNAAWVLGVDDRVGSVEPGKDADLVVWSGDPFSVYTKAERVYIEGALVYDRLADEGPRPRTDFELGYPAAGGDVR